MALLDKILRTKAIDYTYAPITPAVGDTPRTAIQSGGSYISVLLRSMRIVSVRRGWNKFYPVVHSYISVPHRSGRVAEFQSVTSPSRLSELDASHLDRVISLNHRLLGPTPYRGGDLNLEIGLFSVKSDDLAKPFLSILETMAGAAGVSFVSVAMPFVAPLKQGLELLTGSNNISLEIGLSTIISEPETGYVFVMRASREEFKPEELKIAEDFRVVNKENYAIGDHPYMVFSIEASASREDWFLIPDIASVYAELMEAVHKGKATDASELFSTFKRTALTSHDLLASDAKRLVKEVQDDLAEQLPTSMTSAITGQLRPLSAYIPRFSDTISQHFLRASLRWRPTPRRRRDIAGARC
jgi:hypothetical protein